MTEYTNKNQFINVLKKFQHSFTFRFVSPELKKNREFVLEVLKINGLVLEYVSPEFQADPELVINWKVLKYTSEELRIAIDGFFKIFLK